MPDQPTNARLLFIKQAIATTAWPELCVMLLDAMQEQQNQINKLTELVQRLVYAHNQLRNDIHITIKE